MLLILNILTTAWYLQAECSIARSQLPRRLKCLHPSVALGLNMNIPRPAPRLHHLFGRRAAFLRGRQDGVPDEHHHYLAQFLPKPVSVTNRMAQDHPGGVSGMAQWTQGETGKHRKPGFSSPSVRTVNCAKYMFVSRLFFIVETIPTTN